MSFKFNAMQLIIRSETPKISDLKLIFDKLEEGKFNTNNKDYFITKNYENGFYWLYAQSGDSFHILMKYIMSLIIREKGTQEMKIKSNYHLNVFVFIQKNMKSYLFHLIK